MPLPFCNHSAAAVYSYAVVNLTGNNNRNEVINVMGHMFRSMQEHGMSIENNGEAGLEIDPRGSSHLIENGIPNAGPEQVRVTLVLLCS